MATLFMCPPLLLSLLINRHSTGCDPTIKGRPNMSYIFEEFSLRLPLGQQHRRSRGSLAQASLPRPHALDCRPCQESMAVPHPPCLNPRSPAEALSHHFNYVCIERLLPCAVLLFIGVIMPVWIISEYLLISIRFHLVKFYRRKAYA